MCKIGTDKEVKLCQPRRKSAKVKVDACIAPLVQMLNDYGIVTSGACCGHGKTTGWVMCRQDGEQYELKTKISEPEDERKVR